MNEVSGLKFPMFGKTEDMSRSETPNHFASAAPYWSDAVVGIQRPRPLFVLFVRVVRTADLVEREDRARDLVGRAVEVAAEDAVAHDELMPAPTVIGADAAGVARLLERPAEVGQRKRGDLALEAQLHRRVVEGEHGGRERREVVGLVGDLVLVRVVTALRDEEDLARRG